MFEEIDYILEGENAERFASLYASHPGKCDSLLFCFGYKRKTSAQM